MPVKLPEQMESKTLSSVLPGETVWTLPWAMSVDMDGECYLNERYPIEPYKAGDSPMGTMCMLVTRNFRGEYSVDLTNSYRQDYQKQPNSGPPWFAIPVEEIKF